MSSLSSYIARSIYVYVGEKSDAHCGTSSKNMVRFELFIYCHISIVLIVKNGKSCAHGADNILDVACFLRNIYSWIRIYEMKLPNFILIQMQQFLFGYVKNFFSS